MRKRYVVRMLSGLVFALVVSSAGRGTVQGQSTKNSDTIKIDPSGFPADVQKGYRVFGMKCNECHGIQTSLKPLKPASQWTSVVKRMQAMASSHFNDAQAKAILVFLDYYEAHRKSENPSAAQAATSDTVGAAGQQFYDAQGCAQCHAIDGKGGTSAPSLSDVGKRLPKEKLAEVVQEMRTGKSSMPPLPKETTDQQVKDLTDFLVSLNGSPQKQDTGTQNDQKKPEIPTDQRSKPTAQAAPSGNAGAPGQQFYDTLGCAKCHAIGGKGGTSAPSLSDVGKRLPKEKLTEVVQEMRTGKSSMPPLPKETTDQQVKDLTDFLISLNGSPQKQDAGTQNGQKKPETPTDQGSKPAAQAAPSGTVSTGGRQFYDKQGCAKCHAIGGRGGTSAPSLSDVGKRLPKEKLTEVVQEMRTGKSSMPPLPKETTDQQVKDLTDFLISLNGSPQKQDAGTQKEPKTPTDQGSKPTDQAAPSGSVAAPGQQFYDKQGCAKCHAIGGKGGTSAPSLSDVGKRLPKDKLTAVIQEMRTGKSSMPPLPKGTTQQQVNDLVDFLGSLKSVAPKQNASVQKAPETPTDQPSRNSQSQPAENLARLRASDTNGPTALPGILLLSLIAVIAALIGVLVFRPGLTATAGGKILAFFVLFLMPLIAAGIGTTYQIDRSKSTTFCLSCHEMEPFGKSLMVDDDSSHLAAAHFQNHRVPAEEACYTCHTTYAMFGGFRAKLQGLRHVYVHYLGKPPAPEAIRLYDPYNNRECLHCHLGARSFEEGKTHNSDPYLLPALRGNQVSCLSCHQPVHDIAGLNKAKFWKGTL